MNMPLALVSLKHGLLPKSVRVGLIVRYAPTCLLDWQLLFTLLGAACVNVAHMTCNHDILKCHMIGRGASSGLAKPPWQDIGG